jgi:hypothetical protein
MTTDPQPADMMVINGHRTRIEWIGTGEYAIHVGDGYEVDRAELTLAAPAVRGGTPAVWSCWTGPDGRRA